jgi:hypothetical protein
LNAAPNAARLPLLRTGGGVVSAEFAERNARFDQARNASILSFWTVTIGRIDAAAASIC